MEAVFPFYKPKGMSSFQLVSRVRRLAGEKKVGHGGALDPLAEGLLVVGIGREGTKGLAVFLKDSIKEYEAVLRLGAVSETYDAEGPIIENPNSKIQIPKQYIEEILKKFTGNIEQTPPAYSAVKIDGKRAYRLARAGKAPVMKPRRVFIESIEILNYAHPDLRLRIICGSGVYIRSLANDAGRAFGCGAYLADLKRTKVGGFVLADAIHLEDLAANPGLLKKV